MHTNRGPLSSEEWARSRSPNNNVVRYKSVVNNDVTPTTCVCTYLRVCNITLRKLHTYLDPVHCLPQPLHMVAAALNAFSNIRLRHIQNNSDWSITVYNHPLPRSQETEVC